MEVKAELYKVRGSCVLNDVMMTVVPIRTCGHKAETLEAWLLCIAVNQISETVLGEVEKNSFTALSGRGGHSGFLSWKTVIPNLGELAEEFHNSTARVGLLTR